MFVVYKSIDCGRWRMLPLDSAFVCVCGGHRLVLKIFLGTRDTLSAFVCGEDAAGGCLVPPFPFCPCGRVYPGHLHILGPD